MSEPTSRRAEIEAWLYNGGPRSAYDVKRDLLHLLAVLDRVEGLLVEVDGWTPYESRDTGRTFLEDSVRYLVGEIRCALAGEQP